MSLDDCKDTKHWEATRRVFLKILASIGAIVGSALWSL